MLLNKECDVHLIQFACQKNEILSTEDERYTKVTCIKFCFPETELNVLNKERILCTRIYCSRECVVLHIAPLVFFPHSLKELDECSCCSIEKDNQDIFFPFCYQVLSQKQHMKDLRAFAK